MLETPETVAEVSEGCLKVKLKDEFGGNPRTFEFDRELTIRHLTTRAVEFDFPDGEYAAYQVRRSDGDDGETLCRLLPDTKIGDIDVPEDEVIELRLAPALRGA